MPEADGLTAESNSDHGDGNVEVALAVGVSDGVRIGLPVGGVAIVAPGTDIDLGATVGRTGDLEIVGDVLHSVFSPLK